MDQVKHLGVWYLYVFKKKKKREVVKALKFKKGKI